MAHIAFDNPRKGTDLLQAALGYLGPREDVFLLVAGRGSERWQEVSPIDVVPLGYLEKDEALAMAYGAADVICVPSAVENLPNTVLEAMACGKPVVAADAGGVRDVVKDGETGLLCPPGDPKAFATAVGRLVDDPEMRRRIGSEALALVEREYTVAREVDRIHEIYQEILSRRAA